MKHLLLLITIPFISILNVFAQTTIILQPDSTASEYATITTQNPTGQYSDRKIFQNSAWTWGGTPYTWRSLLRFDLTAIPSNAVIDSAFLSLFAYNGPNHYHSTISGSNASTLQRITSPWGEFTVSWNSQPSTTNADAVYLPMSDSSNQDYLNYDIKNMVQYWVSNPANNFGFIFQLDTEQYYRSMCFSSPVDTIYSKHPLLKIYYNIPQGMNEISAFHPLTVYPNPSHGYIYLDLEENIKQGELNILNLVGDLLYSEPIKPIHGKIHLTHIDLSPGIYFVQVRDKEKQYMQKIIME